MIDDADAQRSLAVDPRRASRVIRTARGTRQARAAAKVCAKDTRPSCAI